MVLSYIFHIFQEHTLEQKKKMNEIYFKCEKKKIQNNNE